MELQENTPLILPLFLLNDDIESRDIESPDMQLSVNLTADLLANLCQNPAPEQSISIPLESYELKDIEASYTVLMANGHQAQLLLNHGPVLSAVLSPADAEALFVSPPVDMMPTFDLGLDEEEEDNTNEQPAN
ncbi:hypothetical protein [Pseudoalteromonas luteoviolacea]|uniref:SseB protein N-terminal domain-containing protein n=1 Tax=Pseudoalteromonas luteoviolacea DSM 6061 TaxID=1365250 RepID=A0A166YUU5_9GAMM|nr:hypothetical protein [Pseudoalteromonas luteoviolacea]KZN43546.1 hypothetical protein N475_09090 [Pseudoalteromonas luteoviolacea DSM 6061]KZN57386.1 hypothetical protein N474_08235 [Pseudoalteromonas luteoviolacea CPMOR-2]MBE0388020.1 hypothetical protein [Pseudoalteromonas luteoviolacea DSM 6061]TQF72720.1 hypothetical protein FLM44_17460 [Pseudoalteromonas luteoviolacea]